MKARIVVVCGLLLGACSRDREPPPAAVADQPPRLIPLTGSQTFEGDDPRCAMFVTELVKHPNWTLQLIDDASWHMAAKLSHRSFQIHDTGIVEWAGRDMPTRQLTLTPSELARVRELGTLSCAAENQSEFSGKYRLSWGPSDDGGDAVFFESPLGVAVNGVLDAAIARYVASRSAALGPITITGRARDPGSSEWTPRTAIYQFAIAPGGLLTVRRGKKLLATAWLEPREVIDLVDRFLDPALDATISDNLLRGTMRAAGSDHEFGLSIRGDRYLGAVTTLEGAIDDARHSDSNRHPQ